MECMRALIENDRQADGSFTAWSAPLERAALKKDRYLNGKAPAPPPAAPAPPPAAPAPEGAPADSPFAGKLKQALQPSEAKRES
jgi:hypothetical protein